MTFHISLGREKWGITRQKIILAEITNMLDLTICTWKIVFNTYQDQTKQAHCEGASMPNYVTKQLVKYNHKPPKRYQAYPFELDPVKYGKKSQELNL